MSATAILRACFDVMYYSGASWLMKPLLAGEGVIFCLHHVTPGGGLQEGFAPNSKLEITPEFLGQIITMVRACGYECLSIGEAAERLKSGRGGKRFAVFTLDDGYRDNKQYAWPVFKNLNCPFTIYVAPRIAEGTCELWWRGLEAMIARNTSVDVQMSGQHFRLPSATVQEKWQAWKALYPTLQQMPQHDQRAWIRKVASSSRSGTPIWLPTP